MQNISDRLKTIPRWALITAVVVVIAVIAIAVGGAGRPAQTAQAGPQTVKVTRGDLEGTVASSGQLTPKRDASLAFGVTGIVKKVNVAQGDTVKAGDVLVQLDDAIASQSVDKASLALKTAEVKLSSAQHDFDTKVNWSPNGNQLNAASAGLANAQAAVKAAQSNYDQVAWLPWVSSTTQSMQLEQATNNYDKARADLDYLISNRPDAAFAKDNLQAAQIGLTSAQIDLQIAKDNLDKTSLTAPFTGTVTAVNTEVGEAATGPVVEMVTMDHLEVILDVDEVDLGALKVGQPASITFGAWPGSAVTGKVISIAPKANATANVVNFEVHISLDKTDLDLRAGMTADTMIRTFELKDVLLLPRDSVQFDSQTGDAYVTLLSPDGTTQHTTVTLGQRNEEYVEVTSGLEEGDVVLANASQPLPVQ